MAFYAMLICKYLPVFQIIMVSWFMGSDSLDSKTLKETVQSLEMSETNGLMTVSLPRRLESFRSLQLEVSPS